MRRRIIGVLIGVLVTVIGVEIILSADPLGMAYFHDSYAMNARLVPHPAGWAFAGGDYTLSNWHITVLADHTRRVPDTNPNGVRVVFVGDSVTLGWGVNDTDTFVNRLAQTLPDHRLINAAQNGMNSENVRRMVALYPDVPHIVYYVIWNDPEPTQTPDFPALPRTPPRYSWTGHYLAHIERIFRSFEYDRIAVGYDYVRFERDIMALAADARILLIADDDARPAARIAAAHGAHLIPPHTNPISFIDGHPNPDGHAHIGAAMMTHVRAHVLGTGDN